MLEMLPRAYGLSFTLLRPAHVRHIHRRLCTSGKRNLSQWTDGARNQPSAASVSKDTASDLIVDHPASDPRVLPDRRRTVFSGIQPTGVPHLGNYIGALRQWKNYHDESSDPKVTAQYAPEQYFSIVDLHALTASMPREERKQLRKESYASLLAIGLKNTGTTSVFFQSEVGQTISEIVGLLKLSRFPIIAS